MIIGNEISNRLLNNLEIPGIWCNWQHNSFARYYSEFESRYLHYASDAELVPPLTVDQAPSGYVGSNPTASTMS